jgi:Glycosyltransferase 61
MDSDETRTSADELAVAIIAAQDPQEAAFKVINGMEARGDLVLGEAILLRILYRVKFTDWRLPYLASRIYWLSGQSKLAYIYAAIGSQFETPMSNQWHFSLHMFSFLRDQGMARDALNVIMRSLLDFPDFPIAFMWEIYKLLAVTGTTFEDELARLGVDDIPRQVGVQGRVTPVVTADTFEWRGARAYGGPTPAALRAIGGPLQRPPVEIYELTDVEILIHRNSIIVIDQHGVVLGAQSIAGYPALAARKFRNMPGGPGMMEVREVDCALLIADSHSQPNICHFLLDQITRLAVLRHADQFNRDALLIGPSLEEPFQRDVIDILGFRNYHGISETAHLRIHKLYASSNSFGGRMAHPGHFGADWAVGYLREALGGGEVARNRRIYISRDGARYRRIRNDTDVLELLGKSGFEVVRPEGLTFLEQVALFKGATHIVSPHGAGLANLVFCQPGTHVLEMFHPLQGSVAYAIIGEGAGLDYSTLLCRDGVSDDPDVNDPEVADKSLFGGGTRDIRVNLDGLAEWLSVVTA